MKKQSAFTLVELMVVLAIIAVLGTAGISAYTGYAKKSRDTSRVATSLKLESAVINYKGDHNNKAPTQEQLNEELNNEPILDPVGGADVCLGTDGAPGQPCRFDYVKYNDETYSISYGVESPANMKDNFYQTQFTEGSGETTKVGVYRGTATFIGSPAQTIEGIPYTPTYPEVNGFTSPPINTKNPVVSRLDTPTIPILTMTLSCPNGSHLEDELCVCDSPLFWDESSGACILLGPAPTAPPYYPPPPAWVSFTVTISGNGTVTGNENNGFEIPSTAILTAIPDEGSIFKEWTGDCTGTSLTCSVSVDGPKNVTAVFVRQFTITTNLFGDNNDLTFVSKVPVASNDNMSITYIPASQNSISVTNKDIIVSFNQGTTTYATVPLVGTSGDTDITLRAYNAGVTGNGLWAEVLGDNALEPNRAFGVELVDGEGIVITLATNGSGDAQYKWAIDVKNALNDDPQIMAVASVIFDWTYDFYSEAIPKTYLTGGTGGNITTANQIKSLIQGDPTAQTLVNVSLPSNNNGTGFIVPMEQTYFAVK